MRRYPGRCALVAVAPLAILLSSFGQDTRAAPKLDDQAAKRTADEFQRLYRLDDGEIIKAIPDPRTDVRTAYYKDRPNLGVPQDSSNVHVYYRWRDGGLARNPYWMGGGEQLAGIFSPLIGLQPHGIEGDATLLRTKINADFITRDKAPAEDVVARMEAILRRDFKLPVKLALADLERPCIVVRGRYKFTPAAGQAPIEEGGMDKIEVRAGEIGSNPNRDLNAAGGFAQFLSHLSDHTGHRFVNEAEGGGTDKIFSWHITAFSGGVGLDDDRLDPILENLARDTGLTFERAKRRVRVLTVERSE